MIVLKNITDEEHKDELKGMLVDHYKEVYGHEWVDSYLELLESYPQNKVRDFLIEDLKKRFSSKEDRVQKDMDLLFNEKKRSENIAFGVLNDENIIGYMFLAVHKNIDFYGVENDRYGELYELYIKPEYREEFLKSAKREDFVSTIRNYLENFFKENDVTDILSKMPNEIDDLVLLGEELGFVKENYISEDNKELWKKTI